LSKLGRDKWVMEEEHYNHQVQDETTYRNKKVIFGDEINGLGINQGFSEDHHKELEHELVERARNGDRDAFSELVRKHRAQAYGWANTITRNEFMAEDVVQDALIRAFLHLGTLINTNLFLPWLQRIIRNQAYMKLRRGGAFGKEYPFSGFSHSGTYENESLVGGNSTSDWGNIDQILFRLSRSASEEAQRNSDPIKGLLRRELMDNIRGLLQCLGKRERQIFESHFFGELSPSEIAALYGMTTANVYNLLSRSRSKVQKERIRVGIRLYTQRRAALGLKRVNILRPPNL
jgi:RNA polymerase sigma factor (sigma-70 family)